LLGYTHRRVVSSSQDNSQSPPDASAERVPEGNDDNQSENSVDINQVAEAGNEEQNNNEEEKEPEQIQEQQQ
jgi:hypothetical protein